MPRGRISGDSSKRELRQSQLAPNTDFTLYDFAHTESSAKLTHSSGRIKKGTANSLTTEVKRLQQTSSTMDVAWYERDVEDFNDPETYNEEEFDVKFLDPEYDADKQLIKEQENEDYNTKVNGVDSLVEGRVYPIDLWCLIGRYVRPEDVGRFSQICKYTYKVTHTAQFWQNMYRRYNSPNSGIPESLGPSMVDRVHGLRTRVVKALHYIYPPFIPRTPRLRDVEPQSDDTSLVSLESLLGATCVTQFYEQINGVYHVCWKLRRQGRGGRVVSQAEMLLGDPDVMYNDEEGLVLLQMICPSFILQPSVSGLVLVDVETSAGQGMSSQGCVVRSYSLGHRVKLTFNQRYTGSSQNRVKRRGAVNLKNGSSAVECVVDPAVHIDVIHWWSKSYRNNI